MSAKPYQHLLDAMEVFLLMETEQCCNQLAAVMKRFHPEIHNEISNMITDFKYSSPAKLESGESTSRELVLTSDDFAKKPYGVAAAPNAIPEKYQSKKTFAGEAEKKPEGIVLPDEKFGSVDAMFDHFPGMKLVQIKGWIKDNGMSIHNAATSEQTLDVLNDQIEISLQKHSTE
jgi:hypothetical protein